MKTLNNSHLQLISGKADVSQKNSEGKRFNRSDTFDKAALSLLAAKATGKISEEAVETLALALQQAKCPNTIVQRSLDVSILLNNLAGDASICFKYDLVNFGLKTLPSRTHRYWFTSPQEDINISVSSDSGLPLEMERLSCSPNFLEIKIHFLKPLGPADQLGYRVQYHLKKDFLKTDYYNITTGTLTQRMSMTILAPENTFLASARVGLESADGYISDCPPVATITNEYGRNKLTWNYSQARLGDQFRTHWSLGS